MQQFYSLLGSKTSSFTSRFNMPKRTIIVILAAVLAYVVATYYSVMLNPEVSFLVEAHQRKRSWRDRIASEDLGAPRFVFCGGSNVKVAIYPEWCREKYGLKVLNFGMAAGMGAKVLSDYAIEQVRQGDVLVLSLEPSLLMRGIEEEPLGIQFLVASGQVDLLGKGGAARIQQMTKLRPGARHLMTLFAKIALGRPLHRYHSDELREDGAHEIVYTETVNAAPPLGGRLSESGRILLKSVSEKIASIGGSVIYLPPMCYCPNAQEDSYRKELAKFYSDVSAIVPVVRDPELGINTDAGDFIDTWWHPTKKAAEERTDNVCRLLVGGKFFSVEELASIEGRSGENTKRATDGSDNGV